MKKEYLRSGIISAMIAIIVTTFFNRFLVNHLFHSMWAISNTEWYVVLGAYILPPIVAFFFGAHFYSEFGNVIVSIIVGIVEPILAIVSLILALFIVSLFTTGSMPALVVIILTFLALVGEHAIIIIIFGGV